MPNFKVSVSHQYTRELAVQRLKSHSEAARADLPSELSEVNEVWDAEGNLDFSFKALGMKITGQMVSTESEVTVNGNFPFAALPFRGMIEQQMINRIKEALA